MEPDKTIRCRVAACREELNDGKAWSFFLINDSEVPIQSVLERISCERAGGANNEVVNERFGALPNGTRARIWRAAAWLSLELFLRVETMVGKKQFSFQFPAMDVLEDGDLPLIADLGQPGFQVDHAGDRTAVTSTNLSRKLNAKIVRFLDWAGPGRVVERRGTDLVVLTEDGGTELWRRPLPSLEEGYFVADEQRIVWNDGGRRRLIALASGDGRKFSDLEGASAIGIDGDRLLARIHDGTASLCRTEGGEMIVSLRGLREQYPSALSPDRRWLAVGNQPVQLWDLEEVGLRHSFNSEITAQLEFTPDSAGLLVRTIMTPQSGMQDEVTQRTYNVRSGSLIDERSWWERQ